MIISDFLWQENDLYFFISEQYVSKIIIEIIRLNKILTTNFIFIIIIKSKIEVTLNEDY